MYNLYILYIYDNLLYIQDKPQKHKFMGIQLSVLLSIINNANTLNYNTQSILWFLEFLHTQTKYHWPMSTVIFTFFKTFFNNKID